MRKTGKSGADNIIDNRLTGRTAPTGHGADQELAANAW